MKSNKTKVETKNKNKTPKEEAPQTIEQTPTIETPPSRDLPEKYTYSLTVEIGGESVSTNTDNLVEAVLSFPVGKITSKVLIRVESDGRKVERWLYPFRAKRLFINRMFAEIYCKQLISFLK